jgi:hypothetical protein
VNRQTRLIEPVQLPGIATINGERNLVTDLLETQSELVEKPMIVWSIVGKDQYLH